MRRNSAFLWRNRRSAAAFCTLFVFSAAFGRALFAAAWADALQLRLLSGAKRLTGASSTTALLLASFLPPLTLAVVMPLTVGKGKRILLWIAAVLLFGALHGAAFGAAFALKNAGFYLAFGALFAETLVKLALYAHLCLLPRDRCAVGGRLSRADARRCLLCALAMGGVAFLGATAVCRALTEFGGT